MTQTYKGVEAFAEVERLIVVAAHPDDLETMCGGTLALLIERKMPLYQPEQLNEPGAELGKLARVFLFATDRDPDIFVNVTDVYSAKITASLAHRSQFPQGEEDLEWMKERDKVPGQSIDAQYAEPFKQMAVW